MFFWKLKKNPEKIKKLSKKYFSQNIFGGGLDPLVPLMSFYDDQVSYCPFWRVTFLKCGKNAKNIGKKCKNYNFFLKLEIMT